MKATCYLRIAKTSRGVGFSATSRQSHLPLGDAGRPLPTVTVKLKLYLPDDIFDGAIAELDVAVEKRLTEIAAELSSG